jgi:hypothetical protein
MIDSLASSITNMKQAEVQHAASMSVLRTSLDTTENQAEQLLSLLDTGLVATGATETVSDPMLGTRVDTYA